MVRYIPVASSETVGSRGRVKRVAKPRPGMEARGKEWGGVEICGTVLHGLVVQYSYTEVGISFSRA